MKSIFHGAGAAAALLILAGIAFGQGANPNNENDVILNNGIDVLYIYSDPSINAAYGVGVDALGDYFYKVLPKEIMRHDSGVMEMSGLDITLFDTDWTTPADFWDVHVIDTVVGVTEEGVIEPDFAGSVTSIFLGNSGFPHPCEADPSLCNDVTPPSGGGNPCPTAGTALGYGVDIQLGTGIGDGLLLDGLFHGAPDGTTDYAILHSPPAGMVFATGAPGTCGSGDYSLQDAHSTDENQPDILASVGTGASSGLSPYGGFQLGDDGTGVPTGNLADLQMEVAWTVAQFFEVVLNGRTSDATVGYPAENGIGALNPDVSTGTLSYGLDVYALQRLGEFCFCASSITGVLPTPGIPIAPGAGLLIIPDGIFNTTFNLYGVGIVTLVDNGGDPFDNGLATMGSIPAIPTSAAGLGFHSQCFTFNGAVVTDSTNSWSSTFQ